MPGLKKVAYKYDLKSKIDAGIHSNEKEIRKDVNTYRYESEVHLDNVITIGNAANAEKWVVKLVSDDGMEAFKQDADEVEFKPTGIIFTGDDNVKAFVQNLYQKADAVKDTILRVAIFQDKSGNRWTYELDASNNLYYKKYTDKSGKTYPPIYLKGKNQKNDINDVIEDVNQFLGSDALSHYIITHKFHSALPEVHSTFAPDLNLMASNNTEIVLRQEEDNSISMVETLEFQQMLISDEQPRLIRDELANESPAQLQRVVNLSVDKNNEVIVAVKDASLNIYEGDDYSKFIKYMYDHRSDEMLDIAKSNPQNILAFVRLQMPALVINLENAKLTTTEKFLTRLPQDSILVSAAKFFGFYNPERVTNYQQANKAYTKLRDLRLVAENVIDINKTMNTIERTINKVNELPLTASEKQEKFYNFLQLLGVKDDQWAAMLVNQPGPAINTIRDYINAHESDRQTYIADLWGALADFQASLSSQQSNNSTYATLMDNGNLVDTNNSIPSKDEVYGSDDEVIEVVKPEATVAENVVRPAQILANIKDIVFNIEANFSDEEIRNHKLQELIDGVFPANVKNGINDVIVNGLVEDINNKYSWSKINSQMMDVINNHPQGSVDGSKFFNEKVESLKTDFQQDFSQARSLRM